MELFRFCRHQEMVFLVSGIASVRRLLKIILPADPRILEAYTHAKVSADWISDVRNMLSISLSKILHDETPNSECQAVNGPVRGRYNRYKHD